MNAPTLVQSEQIPEQHERPSGTYIQHTYTTGALSKHALYFYIIFIVIVAFMYTFISIIIIIINIIYMYVIRKNSKQFEAR